MPHFFCLLINSNHFDRSLSLSRYYVNAVQLLDMHNPKIKDELKRELFLKRKILLTTDC